MSFISWMEYIVSSYVFRNEKYFFLYFPVLLLLVQIFLLTLSFCNFYKLLKYFSIFRQQNENNKSDTMSTLPQTSFNYINSIVGSGVIGIPYAFHRAGFGLGFLLLILVAVITDYSLILMVSILSLI